MCFFIECLLKFLSKILPKVLLNAFRFSGMEMVMCMRNCYQEHFEFMFNRSLFHMGSRFLLSRCDDSFDMTNDYWLDFTFWITVVVLY